mmetsp:Transcript_3063/g.4420  ORF Transcript_3063/g.4420 Transcript_3063/m.4420 type:complete len:120 (-) Transcript_3063:1520-1879(-)
MVKSDDTEEISVATLAHVTNKSILCAYTEGMANALRQTGQLSCVTNHSMMQFLWKIWLHSGSLDMPMLSPARNSSKQMLQQLAEYSFVCNFSSRYVLLSSSVILSKFGRELTLLTFVVV